MADAFVEGEVLSLFSASDTCWQTPSWLPGRLDFMLTCDQAKHERTEVSEGNHGGKQPCLTRTFLLFVFVLLLLLCVFVFKSKKPMLKGSIQDGCSHKVSKVCMKLTSLKVDPGFVSTTKQNKIRKQESPES